MDYRHIWPPITDETVQAVLGQITPDDISYYKRQGVFIKFEDAFKESIGRKHALVVSSGTAALHTAMVACELGPDDEVIVPAYTFYATATPLFQTGALPVLVDAAESDGNIDPAKIEAAITARTKAVIVTHMWGMPCDMDAIYEISQRHGLRLIEDCSHAHGALYKGRPVGSFGDIAIWSLQGQKLVTGGEGGIVLTDEDNLHYRALLFGQYNKRCLQEIPEGHPLRKYAVTGMGLKLRAHPFAIAMAHQQFQHLGGWHASMNRNASRLTELMSGIDGIQLPVLQHVGDEPSWYAYTFRVTRPLAISTKQFCEELNIAGIVDADMPGSTCPLNLLPLFQNPGPLFPSYDGKIAYSPGDFPVAEAFFGSAIKLPIDIDESPEYHHVLEGIAATVQSVLEEHSIPVRSSA